MRAHITITGDGEQDALRVDVQLGWKRAGVGMIEALRASRRQRRVARAQRVLRAA